MESQTLEIKPRCKILSNEELVEQRCVEVRPVTVGVKQTQASAVASAEQKAATERFYQELRCALIQPRIDSLENRAHGVWNVQLEAVELIAGEQGKAARYGYKQDNKRYLKYYEALYLLEKNRLLLEYKGIMGISMEQAYLLLLGEEANERFQEYLVYAFFSNAGYLLRDFENAHYEVDEIAEEENVECVEEHAKQITKNDCIWAIVSSGISGVPVPECIQNSPHFDMAKEQMNRLNANIMQPQSADLSTSNESTPAQQSEECDFHGFVSSSAYAQRSGSSRHNSSSSSVYKPNPKRIRRSSVHQLSPPKGHLHWLNTTDELQEFKDLFAEFDIIELKTSIDLEQDVRDLRIRFDAHFLHEGMRDRIKALPIFRIIILEPYDQFPNHDELIKCYKKQLQPVSLLIVSITDSKAVHAFLYYFS